MNRFILALMALLAGFSAQVAPASARVSEGTEIGAAADARLLGRQAAVLAAVAEARTVPSQEVADNRDVYPLAPQVSASSSVLIGIDRARE